MAHITKDSWEVRLQGQFDQWLNDVMKDLLAFITLFCLPHCQRYAVPHGAKVAAVVPCFIATYHPVCVWESDTLL